MAGYGINIFVHAEDIIEEAKNDPAFFLEMMGFLAREAHYNSDWRKEIVRQYSQGGLPKSDFCTRIPRYLRALAADLEVCNPNKIDEV